MDVRERKQNRVTGVTHHHRILWSAADRLMQEADEPPEGKWYAYMAGLLLSFFSFEGLLNYIGEELYPEEWAGEKAFFAEDPYRGTAGKLQFLSDRLAVSVDRSRRPYQSFQSLSKFSGRDRPRPAGESRYRSCHQFGRDRTGVTYPPDRRS